MNASAAATQHAMSKTPAQVRLFRRPSPAKMLIQDRIVCSLTHARTRWALTKRLRGKCRGVVANNRGA